MAAGGGAAAGQAGAAEGGGSGSRGRGSSSGGQGRGAATAGGVEGAAAAARGRVMSRADSSLIGCFRTHQDDAAPRSRQTATRRLGNQQLQWLVTFSGSVSVTECHAQIVCEMVHTHFNRAVHTGSLNP